jgi:hypothetical protein
MYGAGIPLSAETNPPVLPRCPMEQWIQSHICWQGYEVFSRSGELREEGEGRWAGIFTSEKLSDVPRESMEYNQSLGTLSELASRENCSACQGIYLIFQRNIESWDQVVESKILCSIVFIEKGWAWKLHVRPEFSPLA